MFDIKMSLVFAVHHQQSPISIKSQQQYFLWYLALWHLESQNCVWD